MNSFRIGNISLKVFRMFLKDAGCALVSTEGGHEKWKKPGCLRSIILQTHVSPIPEFIIKNNLRVLGLTRKDLESWLLNNQ